MLKYDFTLTKNYHGCCTSTCKNDEESVSMAAKFKPLVQCKNNRLIKLEKNA